MGKINEIAQKVEQSFCCNKFTTEIKDDVVEFDSNGLMFNFVDPVNVPALSINGEEIGGESEPQVQSDFAQKDATAAGYIAHKPYLRAEGNGVVLTVQANTHTPGAYSYAEGSGCVADGRASSGNSYQGLAHGDFSAARNWNVTATHKSQLVKGEFNVIDPSPNLPTERGNFVEIIGNGTRDILRSNIRTLDWNGNMVVKGKLKANGINISDAISTVKFRINDGSLQATSDGGITWHTLGFSD
jgi:hypothetical protein